MSKKRTLSQEEKLEKKIKKTIIRGVKYLRKYRLEIIDQEAKEKFDDKGISIMLAYFQGRYGVELGYEEDCHNLYKCTQKYLKTHPRNIFNFKREKNHLFSTDFLEDIYFQKHNKFPTQKYIEYLEKYLNKGNSFMSHLSNLMPVLDLFSQRKVKYLNVALALFGLAEKKPLKVLKNHSYQKLKKKVVYELIKIFNNETDHDPYYLDSIRSYALLLIAFLGDLDKVEKSDYLRFIKRLIRNQSVSGHWVHADLKDGTDQTSNLLLTIFSLGTLLEYINLDMIRSHSRDDSKSNLKSQKEKSQKGKNQTKDLEEGFMGFGGGGFMTQSNLDNMWDTPCMGSLIELMSLLVIIVIAIYIFVKMYQSYYI